MFLCAGPDVPGAFTLKILVALSRVPMRFKFPRCFLPLALILGLGGCTKHARMERHVSRGDKLMRAGSYGAAEVEYRTATQLMPDDAEPEGRLGTLFFNQGRILAGYLLLHQAAERDRDDPQLRLTLGLASLTAARTAEARTSAKTVLDRLPTNEEALLLLVYTSVTARDVEESRRLIENLRQKNPDSAGFHVALGALLLMKRDLDGAEKELKAALTLDPKSASAYGELGRVFQARHQPKPAREALKQASDLSPFRSPHRMNYVDFLVKAGAIDEAAKELATIAEQAPDYIPAWTEAMQIAFTQKRYDEAIAAAEKILVGDPANYDALLEIAYVKLAKKETDDAITDLKRLEVFYPRVALVKYELGIAYLDKQDPDSAQQSLSQAIILSPHYDAAIVLLAEINVRKGNYAAVVAALEPLVKKGHGLSGRAYFLLAQAYRAQGDVTQALAVFEFLTRLDAKAPEGPYLMGSLLNELRRFPEARAALEQSLKIAPDYWPALEALVDLDLAEGKQAEATSRLESLRKQYPKAATPWLLLARVHVAAQNFPEAENDLLKAIDLDPAAPYAYLQLARIYFSTQQMQQAVDKLTVLTAKTHNTAGLMELGILQNLLEHYDAAREKYEEILAHDPKFVPALNNLAVLQAQNLGNLDQGYAFAKRARDLAPKDPFIEDTLGWILFRKGDYLGALPLVQDSAAKNPGDAEVQYHAGMVNYLLGREQEARLAFQKSVAAPQASPGQADAGRRLAILQIDPATAGPAVRADLEEQVRKHADDPFAFARLAAIQAQAGAFAAAAANFEAALKLAPRSANIMAALSRLYFGPLQQVDRARSLAASAHEQAPQDAAITGLLGRVLYATGNYARSSELLQDAVRSLPGEPDLLYDLALADYGAGRVPEAAGSLQAFLAAGVHGPRQEQAQAMAALIEAAKSPALAAASLADAQRRLASEPDFIPALMVAALARERAADFAGAAQVYEKILARDDFFAPAARELAMIYGEKLGDDDKAEAMALKARKVFTNDPELDYELGVIDYRRGNFVGAVPFLTRSLASRPTDAETLFYLGMTHYSLKSSGEARNELKRALQLGLPEKDADDATRVLVELDRMDPER
jgi:tetratricopeptide (TPR) repeat protein